MGGEAEAIKFFTISGRCPQPKGGGGLRRPRRVRRPLWMTRSGMFNWGIYDSRVFFPATDQRTFFSIPLLQIIFDYLRFCSQGFRRLPALMSRSSRSSEKCPWSFRRQRSDFLEVLAKFWKNDDGQSGKITGHLWVNCDMIRKTWTFWVWSGAKAG